MVSKGQGLHDRVQARRDWTGADKAQKGVKSHRRALTVRGSEPRERIDVDQIIANTQILTRSYGSDPIRTELNPVRTRSMLDDIQADLV